MASIELGQPEGVQPEGVQPGFDDSVVVERLVIPVSGGTIPVKASSDVLHLEFDWSDAIPDGETLQSVEHTVPGGVVRDDQETNGDGTSDLDVSGGAHAAIYQLTIVATMSNAAQVTRTWPLRVFNSA